MVSNNTCSNQNLVSLIYPINGNQNPSIGGLKSEVILAIQKEWQMDLETCLLDRDDTA